MAIEDDHPPFEPEEEFLDDPTIIELDDVTPVVALLDEHARASEDARRHWIAVGYESGRRRMIDALIDINETTGATYDEMDSLIARLLQMTKNRRR